MLQERRASSCYYANRDCEYFPCHKGADPGDFNCLFCFCPLYPLGEDCGGSFRLLPQGGKDCGACLFPHKVENYEKILARTVELCKRFPPEKGKE